MTDRIPDVHPQRLRVAGETDPQELGKRFIGGAIDKALARAGMTKQEAAFAMGYSDSGVIGRWVAHTETPQFAKLWMLGEGFRREFVVTLAEAIADVDVQIQIVLRRSA